MDKLKLALQEQSSIKRTDSFSKLWDHAPSPPPKLDGSLCPSPMGLISMLLLIFFSAAGSIVLRYSRTTAGPQYLASTVVVLTEASKLLICVLIASVEALWARGLHEASRDAPAQIGAVLRESPCMAVPAGLYVIQQLLLILAATHLDAVSFQICSQLRIPSTAVFAVLLLGQQLSLTQWLSVPVLALGVGATTLSNMSLSDEDAEVLTAEDWGVGIGACFVAGMSSGYASVYFEKHVKKREGLSLWVKNVQLSMYGLPLALVVLLLKDAPQLGGASVFQGFGWITAAVIALQVAGGLAIAMVIKFADNILKNFAYAIAVLVVVCVSVPLFGASPTPLLFLGMALVIASMMMYGKVDVWGLASKQCQLLMACITLPSSRRLTPVGSFGRASRRRCDCWPTHDRRRSDPGGRAGLVLGQRRLYGITLLLVAAVAGITAATTLISGGVPYGKPQAVRLEEGVRHVGPLTASMSHIPRDIESRDVEEVLEGVDRGAGGSTEAHHTSRGGPAGLRQAALQRLRAVDPGEGDGGAERAETDVSGDRLWLASVVHPARQHPDDRSLL